LPGDINLAWANLFAQDDISLHTNLNLTLGLRLERNDYTGVDVLPTVRLAWKLTPDQLIWGDISRAVRAPSRLDRDLFIPGNSPYLLDGGPNFQSEVSNVYEIGYRAQPFSAVSYSVTAFHQIYEHLRSIDLTSNGSFVIDNQMSGVGNGVEAWGDYQVTRAWRLSAGLMELRQELGLDPGSNDPGGTRAEGNDPKYQWTLRSSFNITDKNQFDLSVRHVGALPNPSVPAYTAVDARFGWQVQPNIELSLTGQNLLGPEHIEFGAPTSASEIGRSIFLKLLWRM
jgi:iron complex outermembrane receptor protein